MRITNGMMHTTYMSDLQNNLQRLYTASMQQATGKRIQRLSDDPVGLIQGLNARQQISRIDQFQRNITDAKRWLDTSESSMRDLSSLAQDAYELAVQAGSDTVPDDVRASAMAPKAKALLDQLIATANATTSDEYTFGGVNLKNQAPITKATADDVANQGDGRLLDENGDPMLEADGTPVTIELDEWLYNGVPLSAYYDSDTLSGMVGENTLEFQIGFSLEMPVTMTAPELLVYKSTENGEMRDLIAKLQEFCTELENGCTAEKAQEFIQEFQDAQTHIDSAVSDMGGRWNRVEMMEDRYSKDELMYSTVKSELEDMDIAEAIMNFSMMSSVYNASLQLGPKVLQPTLMDYLR